MVKLARLLQLYFGFTAVVLLAGSCDYARHIYALAHNSHGGSRVPRTAIWLLAYLVTSGILAAFAWWNMRRGGRSAAWWMLAAALCDAPMPLFGVFTVAAGLILVFRRSGRRALLRPHQRGHQPKAGDGTSRWTQGAFWALQWGCMLAGFPFIGKIADRLGLAEVGTVWLDVLSVPLALVGSVLLHEFGHVAGTWASEFEVRAFRVGPFGLTKLEGHWRFEWASLLGGGGVVALPTKEDALRSRALFFIAAGPVASALAGSVCLLLFLTAPGAFWQPAWRTLATLALFTLTDAVTNLLPVGVGNGGYSDGARLWQLALNGTWCRHILFGYYQGLSMTTKLSPADWPTNLVEESARFGFSTNGDLSVVLLAYLHFRLKGNEQRARAYFNTLAHRATQLPERQAGHLAPELGFYEAFYNADLRAARGWMDRSRTRSVSDHWRGQAAVLGLSGDLEGGREAWRAGWRMVSKAPFNGHRLLDQYDFRRLAERWWPDLASLTLATAPATTPTVSDAVVV